MVVTAMAGRAGAAEPGYALGPVAMDSYAQHIIITLKSATAAHQARLTIAPLYHGLRAAVSTRMDDCNLNDLAVAQIMAKYGQHGTFYLNNPGNWWQDSTATGIEVSGDRESIVPPRLLSGGNSIGGHTLSHEFLPALSANAAFREIMGIRVALETKTASPVLSFTYPFVYYRSETRDGRDRSDLEEILRRAGFYQLAEDRYNRDWASGLEDGVFVVLDGKTAGYADPSALTSAGCEDMPPLFLITMHPWVSAWGGPDYPKLAAIYRQWAGRDDCWYCNQNQYGAYCYQAHYSRLETWVGGHTIRAVLIRPDPLDLDDWGPLTLRVDGVGRDDVVAVECPDAQVQPVPEMASYAFDLFHGREHGKIESYGQADDSENSDQPAPATSATEGLQVTLTREVRTLRLALHNASGDTLRDIRVTFRLPLRWRDGVLRQYLATLASGAAATLEVPLMERANSDHYVDGTEYDVAQIDFRGGRRARLYAVYETTGVDPAEHFARDGFWKMGPFPPDSAEFELNSWAKPFLEGREPSPDYEMQGGGKLLWGTLAHAQAAILDPDIIPTTGTSNMTAYYKRTTGPAQPQMANGIRFLLWGRIVSPRAQTVRLVASHDGVHETSVNGRMVEGDKIELREGANEVRMLYSPAAAVPGLDRSFDISNYGCYFRLVDADGKRVTDIRYERPPLP